MRCSRCGAEIEAQEAMSFQGESLCEDCYIDLAAKPKTCDPWAVYSATNLPGASLDLSQEQQNILDYLARNGPTPPERVAQDLGLSQEDLEREMAPLRHMEKARAKLQDGRKMLCLWQG